VLGPFPLERLTLRFMIGVGRLPCLGPQVPNEARDPLGNRGHRGENCLERESGTERKSGSGKAGQVKSGTGKKRDRYDIDQKRESGKRDRKRKAGQVRY